MISKIRSALFAAALVAASVSTSAHSGGLIEGRVVSVVPHLSLSFGSMRNDGFRVEYESGGRHYNTHSHVRPGRVIMVPPPVIVVPRPHFGGGHWRDHDRWDDRRHWRDHDRWDDRRHWRGDNRGHKHGRHGGRGRGHD